MEPRGKAVCLAVVVSWPKWHLPARAALWNRSAPAGYMDCPHEAALLGAAKRLPRCPENRSAHQPGVALHLACSLPVLTLCAQAGQGWA